MTIPTTAIIADQQEVIIEGWDHHFTMQAPLKFSIADPGGKVMLAGEGNGTIGAETLVIAPKDGESRSFSLRDIASIEELEYRIKIVLANGDQLFLFNLGYKFEDFARNLVQARNELSLKDLLMEEKPRRQGIKADFLFIDAGGQHLATGKCEARLYETAMVVMPERSDLIRVPYSDLLTCTVDSFKAIALLESGVKIEFSRLGKELDPFRGDVVKAITELSVRVQEMLKDAYPEADPNAILKASQFMKEGRAAARSDLEGACPGLWSRLEMKIAGLGIGEEYAFLASRSNAADIRIGMKRTFAGDTRREYIWFLAPIHSKDASKGGNAIAFEASSGEEEGRATYFFRIVSRKEYSQAVDLGLLDKAAQSALTEIAKGLLAVNFRREPIYLPDESLYSPQYTHYRYSIMRIPELRLLRERYIGRVVHSSIEQWKLDVDELLAFNAAQENDAKRWIKSSEG